MPSGVRRGAARRGLPPCRLRSGTRCPEVGHVLPWQPGRGLPTVTGVRSSPMPVRASCALPTRGDGVVHGRGGGPGCGDLRARTRAAAAGLRRTGGRLRARSPAAATPFDAVPERRGCSAELGTGTSLAGSLRRRSPATSSSPSPPAGHRFSGRPRAKDSTSAHGRRRPGKAEIELEELLRPNRLR
jgi:hypothetical protein